MFAIWLKHSSQKLKALGIALAFVLPWLSLVIYVSVALMWLVPDKRFEARLVGEGGLEPPYRKVLDPKSSASANSATRPGAKIITRNP